MWWPRVAYVVFCYSWFIWLIKMDVLKVLFNPCINGMSNLSNVNSPTGQTIHFIETTANKNHHCHTHLYQPNISSVVEHDTNMGHPATGLSFLANKPRYM
jgi:hypothetical protein